MNLTQIGTAINIGAEAGPQLKKLKGVASNVEAIFLKDLMAQMRKGVNQVNFGQNFGGDIYQDMMDQSFAEAGAKSGSFGIGKILYSQFSKEVMNQAAADVARKATEAKTNTQA